MGFVKTQLLRTVHIKRVFKHKKCDTMAYTFLLRKLSQNVFTSFKLILIACIGHVSREQLFLLGAFLFFQVSIFAIMGQNIDL